MWQRHRWGSAERRTNFSGKPSKQMLSCKPAAVARMWQRWDECRVETALTLQQSHASLEGSLLRLLQISDRRRHARSRLGEAAGCLEGRASWIKIKWVSGREDTQGVMEEAAEHQVAAEAATSLFGCILMIVDNSLQVVLFPPPRHPRRWSLCSVCVLLQITRCVFQLNRGAHLWHERVVFKIRAR